MEKVAGSPQVIKGILEGSIYPLLLHLQKDKLMHGEIRASDGGPNRKSYTLTSVVKHRWNPSDKTGRP